MTSFFDYLTKICEALDVYGVCGGGVVLGV